MPHSYDRILVVKSCPCGLCVPANLTVSVSKRTGLAWWRLRGTVIVALRECRSSFHAVLTTLHSGLIGGTTECMKQICLCSNLEYTRHLSKVTKHVPMVLLRQLHDTLRVAKSSWVAWTYFWIRTPSCVLLLQGLFSDFVDWIQSLQVLAMALRCTFRNKLSYVLVNSSPVTEPLWISVSRFSVTL